MVNKKIRRAFVFLVVSVAFLFILAFISGAISLLYPDDFYIFGLPFSIDFFIWGIFLALITVILYLYFPRLKNAREL